MVTTGIVLLFALLIGKLDNKVRYGQWSWIRQFWSSKTLKDVSSISSFILEIFNTEEVDLENNDPGHKVYRFS